MAGNILCLLKWQATFFFHIRKDFKLRKLEEDNISEVVILINEVVIVYKFSNLLHQGHARSLLV